MRRGRSIGLSIDVFIIWQSTWRGSKLIEPQYWAGIVGVAVGPWDSAGDVVTAPFIIIFICNYIFIKDLSHAYFVT